MKLLIKAYSHSIEDTHVQVGQVRLTLGILPSPIFCLHPVIVLKTFQMNYRCGSELFWSMGSRLAVLDKNLCSVSFRSMRNSSRTWRTLALRTSFRSLQSRREPGRRDLVSHRKIKHFLISPEIAFLFYWIAMHWKSFFCKIQGFIICHIVLSNVPHITETSLNYCVCVCVDKVQ